MKAQLAVLEEVISWLSHFKMQASSGYRLDSLFFFLLSCAEEILGWFVSHRRQQRPPHRPPHAHTAVYHSVPTT